MKTLVIFYSYTGKTKRLALEFAAKEAAANVEIRERRRPGKLKAYTLGIIDVMLKKAWQIEPLKPDPAAYGRLVIFSPVWAGNPPPAVRAALLKLPEGKTVSIKMVSASGQSSCKDWLEEILKYRGCTFKDFEDIKA